MRIMKCLLSVGMVILGSVHSVHSDSDFFTDTVILKNRKELKEVKAVCSSESCTVISSYGEKMLYRKDEVLEVKKNVPQKAEIFRQSLTSYGIWSSYLGEFTWEGAEQKCRSVRMRLPDRTELLLAFRSGAYESWKKETGNLWFWTSEEIQSSSKTGEEKKPAAVLKPSEENPEVPAENRPAPESKKIYNVNMFNGDVFLRESGTLNGLRCIR